MSRLQNLFDDFSRLGFHPESAWWLLLLPLCLLAWLPRWRRRASIVHASTETFAGTGGSWVRRLRWLPPSLRTGGIALLIICMARPLLPASDDSAHAALDSWFAAASASLSTTPKRLKARVMLSRQTSRSSLGVSPVCI